MIPRSVRRPMALVLSAISLAVVATTSVPAGAAADTAAPVTTITSPPDSSSYPTDMAATVQGTSTDNVGVVKVLTLLYDDLNEVYWNGTQWGIEPVWVTVVSRPAGAKSLSWSTQLPHANHSGYYLWARAVDAAGNLGNQDRILFTTEYVSPPETVVITPKHGAMLSSPVNVRGTATDNVGVAGVQVAIRDRSTLQWWTGTGWGSHTNHAATLTSPGAASSPWQFSWTPPQPGSYLIQVRAVDWRGNIEPTPVNRQVQAN